MLELLFIKLAVVTFLVPVAFKLWRTVRNPQLGRMSYVGGGGGQPPAPAPPDYAAQSAANIATQNNQARIDAENAAKADAAKAIKDEEARARFGSSSGAAKNAAYGYGQQRLASMGISDNYGIMDAYNSEVARAAQSIPDLDPNPGNYFTPALFDNALTQQRSGQRTKLNQQIDTFAPQGFENDKFADTADDSIINSIINEQSTNAGSYLTRAHARGQLDQTGFDYANQQLGNAKSGATSRANTMGMGVIQKDRDVLGNLSKDARNQVTNWDFGSSFDPNIYKTRIDNSYGSLSGSLDGDIRNAFGDTQFFDPTSLVTKGGAFQGQQNPGTTQGAGGGAAGNPLLGAINDDLLQRSAGTQGAF